MKSFFLGFHIIVLCILFTSLKGDAVCTEATLVIELTQDIKDNGKLDCLRKPLNPPTNRAESDDEKKLRLEGAWDTDCAFEADYDWLKSLKELYGLKSGLVDANGKPVDSDFDDQADMCEIIRAIIAGDLLEGAKLDDLNPSIVDGIDCPGEGELNQSEICAVSGGAASQKYSWFIFLNGLSITAKSRPTWELEESSKKRLDQLKGS